MEHGSKNGMGSGTKLNIPELKSESVVRKDTFAVGGNSELSKWHKSRYININIQTNPGHSKLCKHQM